jgi:hypothetical protein
MSCGIKMTRPNHVWFMDITYIPAAQGFVYLTGAGRGDTSYSIAVAVDHDAGGFLGRDIGGCPGSYGRPEIANTDHESHRRGVHHSTCQPGAQDKGVR